MGKKNKPLKTKEQKRKSREWQKAHREKMRAQGIRLIQVAVPEGNIEMVRAMCRRLMVQHVEMLNKEVS